MNEWKNRREEFFDNDFPLKFAYIIESRYETINTIIKCLRRKMENVEM
jgi:hypothetical protein